MKLLAQKDAKASIKKDNESLLESNLRLRRLEKNVLDRLNLAKLNYDPEKVKALEDFDRFCKEIQEKKSKLLAEYVQIEKMVETKKDIYYGLIEKQDVLLEEAYQMEEKHKKLDLRESFVVSLEQEFRNKTT